MSLIVFPAGIVRRLAWLCARDIIVDHCWHEATTTNLRLRCNGSSFFFGMPSHASGALAASSWAAATVPGQFALHDDDPTRVRFRFFCQLPSMELECETREGRNQTGARSAVDMHTNLNRK